MGKRRSVSNGYQLSIFLFFSWGNQSAIFVGGLNMNKERGGALFFIVVGVYALFLAIKLPFGTLAKPGSALFPFALSICLIMVGLLLFVSAKGNERVRISLESIRGAKKLLQTILITICFIIALERLGYLITIFLYLFILFLWICQYRWWIALVLSGCFAPASWLFFGKILDLQLPVGPWGL